jgi:hypothetical protein
VVDDVIKSWRLPRHVQFDGTSLNLKPATWVIAEADGSLALNLAASLGWNMSFARDLQILKVTHNLSAKIDASLKATFGFSVSGKYVLVAGREDAGNTVRLQLYKQKTKGLDFGLNLEVGVQGDDPQLPDNFDDFIEGTFGVHGLQVLKDLRAWTDPNTDLGQKLAGLADQTAIDLLKKTTGIDPSTEFDNAKKFLGDVLNKWDSLPDQVSSMLWGFIGKESDAATVAEFKTLLGALSDPGQATDAIAKALQKATFGDSPSGRFLEAPSDQGLLALFNQLHASGGIAPINNIASRALDLINGKVIANLQQFIEQKLDLDQIRKAVSDADFTKIDQWLQNRLANFLDKQLQLDDLKDIQKAINTLDTQIDGYYKMAVQALKKRYDVSFATTYQKTTTDTALIDVSFDLSKKPAANMYTKVVVQSNLDDLLTIDTEGVTIGMAKLSHEIKRNETVDLHMPFFDFTSTHVNDAMTTLTAEDQGSGRMLLYQINAKDSVTVKNRMASQLSILASLQAKPGQMPQFDSSAALIAYEMRQVKAALRPDDLEERTKGFIRQYLGGLFGAGDSSLQTYYADLDHALTVATGSPSNQLGDTAISMQLALPISVLAGWFQPRSGARLLADQRLVSQALQVAWKKVLPAMYFQNLDNFQPQPNVAALLTWSSLPVSTSLPSGMQTDVFWDFLQKETREGAAGSNFTHAALSAKLVDIHDVLVQEGISNASFFDPKRTDIFINQALNSVGVVSLNGLLQVEEDLVEGARDTLKKLSKVLADSGPAMAPSVAIKAFSEFGAALTDTFNDRVRGVFAGVSARAMGPMLLVEASQALGSAQAQPSALLNLYALKPGHAFKLGDFVEGTMPPQAEVALTQTLLASG